MTALTALALALSSYLSWHYVAGGSVIGCGSGSPCDQILNSRWSAVGGVLPVSGLAAGTYMAMLLATFFIGPPTESQIRQVAWRAMLVLVGAVAGSAVWFIIVQKWLVGAFCPYCMATHVTGVLLAILVIWRAPGSLKSENRNPKSERNSKSEIRISDFKIRSWSLAGVGLAGILAVSQVAFTPPGAFRAGDSRNKLPALDPHTVPLVGSPDAPLIVTLLFDYECPHCQQLYFMLDEVIRRYNGRVAFALCPAPLNTHCNPYVARDDAEFADSCELAKIGLAVWKANPEAFASFDRWMFSFDSGDRWQPRNPDAARAKAIELVGETKLAAAVADPWVARYLQTSTRIYGATLQGDKGGVPRMVFGSRWVIPQPNDAEDLLSILQNSLGLPKP